MERIKQALDKARLERAAESVVPVSRGDEGGGGSLTAADIRYSQTRVQALDPTVLRENRIIYGSSDATGLTAYKMLRTQVMQRMAARGWNALAVTSPAPGDGKSLTAINLAISLAREFIQRAETVI